MAVEFGPRIAYVSCECQEALRESSRGPLRELSARACRDGHARYLARMHYSSIQALRTALGLTTAATVLLFLGLSSETRISRLGKRLGAVAQVHSRAIRMPGHRFLGRAGRPPFQDLAGIRHPLRSLNPVTASRASAVEVLAVRSSGGMWICQFREHLGISAEAHSKANGVVGRGPRGTAGHEVRCPLPGLETGSGAGSTA